MDRMSKKKWIYLDADPLLFEVCEGTMTKTGGFKSNESGEIEDGDYKESLKQYKKRFKLLVQDIEDEVAANEVGKIKGIKVIISDPKNNFRYEIAPDYKANRETGSRSKLFYRLRDWALKHYGYVKGVEADDVVAYYVRKGHIGASLDKDLLRGVEGTWFDTYHSRRSMHTTSKLEARNFNLIQTLMGDPTDNIKALPKKKGDPMIPCILPEGVKRQPFKVTEKLAIDLLDEFGWDWEGVIKAYESKGFSEKEAIVTKRLVSMNHWTPKKGVRLWTPKKGI